MKLSRCIVFMCLVLVIPGCATIGGMKSVQKIAINVAEPSLEDIMTGVLASDDIVNAESLCMTLLPLLDNLVTFSPHNKRLLAVAGQAYMLYSFGFVEDVDPARAIRLYAKSRDYGIRSLRENKDFRKALDAGKDYPEAVKSLNKEDMDAIFYTGMGWTLWTMLSAKGGDIGTMTDLPKVRALMDRAIQLDEGFWHGGPYLFYGAYNGAMGVMLGGGAEPAKASFDKAFAISDKFLPTHLFYAQYYATLIGDEALFDKELQYIFDTPADILPDMSLAAYAVKKKAKILLEKKGNWF